MNILNSHFYSQSSFCTLQINITAVTTKLYLTAINWSVCSFQHFCFDPQPSNRHRMPSGWEPLRRTGAVQDFL